MSVLTFSATSETQRAEVLRNVGERNRLLIVSRAKFYVSDPMIQQYLSISRATFMQVKNFFDNDGGANKTNRELALQAHAYLKQAAESICTTLGPINGLIINRDHLEGRGALMYFMDKPMGQVESIAKHRASVLLKALSARNPQAKAYVIDDGTVTNQPLAELLKSLTA